MPENQNFIGEKWTDQSIKFLTKLGWSQLGTKNFDIPCLHHPARRGQGHGIDSLFQFKDPYLGKTINVIVESKYRKWDGLSTENLKKFIIQVNESLECAPESDIFRQLNATDIYTGLILCWCNDGNYDHSMHQERLKKVVSRGKNYPYNIFLASNNEMIRWYSVITEMELLRSQNWKVKYFYPSINYNDRTDADRQEHLTLFHMFSKYIFAQSTRMETHNRVMSPVSSSIIFSLDAVSVESLTLLYDVCRQYQMQRDDELIIYLYANENEARVPSEHFQRKLKEADEKEVEIRYLRRYDGIIDIPTLYSEVG